MAQSDEPDLDFLTGSLGYAVKRAQLRIHDAIYGQYAVEQITPARMTALWMIETRPGLSQSALAERMHVNRASIIKIVNYLKTAGLIVCRENPEDRRSHILETTKEGRAKLGRLARLTEAFEKDIAKKLTSKERATLMVLLEKVAS